MSHVKVFRSDKFSENIHQIFENYHLSWKAKGLILYLLSIDERHGGSSKLDFMSQLESKSLDGRDSVRTGFQELMNQGYCKKIQIRSEDGRIQGVDYHVFDFPIAEGKTQTSGNSSEAAQKYNRRKDADAEKPKTEKGLNGDCFAVDGVGFSDGNSVTREEKTAATEEKTDTITGFTVMAFSAPINTCINTGKDKGGNKERIKEREIQEISNEKKFFSNSESAEKKGQLANQKTTPPSCVSPPSSVFVPPNENEVKLYLQKIYEMQEKEAVTLSLEFVKYYDTVGWVTGNGEKVKSWQGLVKVWYLNFQRSRKSNETTKYKPRKGGQRNQPNEIGTFTSDEFEGVKGW